MSTSNPSSDTVRDIAIIGAGYWGRNIVRNMEALGRLHTIVEQCEATRHRFAKAHPNVHVTDRLADALDHAAIRGVMVVVPAPQHFELACMAIDAGKHVYVEKPLALEAAHGHTLVHRAAAAGVQLMVGHLLLYHPCVRYLKDTITRGELGEVLYLHSQRVNLGKVRSDENAMWSLAPHDISVALYLLNQAPVSVSAQGFCYLQPESAIEDVVFMTLSFEDGQAAHIHTSWLDPHKRRQLTVVGSQRMLSFDDMAASEKVRIYDKGVDAMSAQPYESYAELLTLRQGDVTIPHIPMREPLRALCRDFLNAVDHNVPALATGQGGADVLDVLAAAQTSLDQGGVPVRISAIADSLEGT